jgi:hypothetical protein
MTDIIYEHGLFDKLFNRTFSWAVQVERPPKPRLSEFRQRRNTV